MPKIKERNGKKLLKSFDFNGYTFKPGTKVVWNWTSSNCKFDEQGRAYLVIRTIFEENGIAKFKTKEGICTHTFEDMERKIEGGPDNRHGFNIRPYIINPLTEDMRSYTTISKANWFNYENFEG